MLFAEGEISQIILAIGQIILAIATLVTAVGGVIVTIRGHRINAKKIDDVKVDVKENTDLTEKTSIHVDDKVDSAVREVKEAKSQAEKITETAAAKVGVIIGKALSDKASMVADRVADVAFKNAATIERKVDQIAKNVKGEDGTCLTGKVEEHTRQIAELKNEVVEVKNDIALIKGDTKQIIDMLSARGGGI